MMNKTTEKLFRKSADHLIAQGITSEGLDADGQDSCLFEGPDGLMCAIGCLIGNRRTRKSFDLVLEQINDPKLLEAIAKSNRVVKESIDTSVLLRLQRIHDSGDPSAWPTLLEEMAKQYNIDWKPND